jgi:hypothetical protein
MMRFMKALWRCALVGLVVGMFGCEGGGGGGGGGSAGDPALVGNWKMTSMSVNGSGYFAPATIGWDIQFQLNEDGSANASEVWKGASESNSGGWTVTDKALNMQAGDYNWTGAYSVGANSFTLSGVPNYDGEGDTGSFVFTRQ